MKSPEFKVGLLVIVATAIVGIMSFTISDDPNFLGTGKKAWVLIPNATGLNKNSIVRMAGINVGVIKDITLEDEAARVDISLSPKVKLKESATVEMLANGILGDKHLEISAGNPQDPELADGGQIKNFVDKGSFDAVLNKVTKIADDVGKITTTLKNATTGEGDESSPIGRIFLNLEDLTEDLRDITNENKDKIDGIVENMHQISSTLNDFVNDESPAGFKEGWSKMVSSIHRIDGTLRNVEEITEKINSGRGTIGKLINDETTVEELNTAISGVNKLLDTANKIQTSFDYHYEYLSQALGKSYLSVTIQPGLDRYYLIGVVDDPKGVVERTQTTTITTPGGTVITDESKTFKNKIKLNAQFAKNFYDFTTRAGLFESSGGVGVDYTAFRKKLRISAEAFDFGRADDALNFRAYVRYKLFNYFYLIGGGDDVFSKQGNSSTFVGAGLDINNDDLKLFLSKSPF